MKNWVNCWKPKIMENMIKAISSEASNVNEIYSSRVEERSETSSRGKPVMEPRAPSTQTNILEGDNIVRSPIRKFGKGINNLCNNRLSFGKRYLRALRTPLLIGSSARKLVDENWVNCWNPKANKAKAISSEATQMTQDVVWNVQRLSSDQGQRNKLDTSAQHPNNSVVGDDIVHASLKNGDLARSITNYSATGLRERLRSPKRVNCHLQQIPNTQDERSLLNSLVLPGKLRILQPWFIQLMVM